MIRYGERRILEPLAGHHAKEGRRASNGQVGQADKVERITTHLRGVSVEWHNRQGGGIQILY